ncbi:unnamed protein product [marine sediment metagenome]|uniref:Terminase small subunit n=1 Tax=marine sediment metagenome TaxID=412755 RepID=X0TF30_9ZZZZ
MHKEVQAIAKQYDLTYKQALFCISYTGNASEAAQKAGYKQYAVEGCRLLKHAKVKACLEGLTVGESTSDHVLSREQLMVMWSDQAKDTAIPLRDRQTAMQSIARSYGMYIDKQAIALQVEHLDRLTDKELIDRLGPLLAIVQAGGIPIPLLSTDDSDQGD